MAFCKNCGTEMKEGTVFCPNCGQGLNAQPQASIQVQSNTYYTAPQPTTTPAANQKTINKHIFVWIGAFLVGGFGVDRFMRGQIGLGIFKLLIGSWLTLGIWPLVDWIIAMVKAYGGSFGQDENLVFINGKYAK